MATAKHRKRSLVTGCGLSDEQIEGIVVQSRAAQGLPPTVDRPEAIEKLVVLLRGPDPGAPTSMGGGAA